PLAIAEGEFEALLLAQELAGLASVITLGAAGDKATPAVLGAMLAASPWLIAGDADAAGDESAGGWLARSGRGRKGKPPGPFKDWTGASQGGVGLRRWWAGRLGGIESPPLYTWNDLAAWRWGPAVGDPTPGIVAP